MHWTETLATSRSDPLSPGWSLAAGVGLIALAVVMLRLHRSEEFASDLLPRRAPVQIVRAYRTVHRVAAVLTFTVGAVLLIAGVWKAAT